MIIDRWENIIHLGSIAKTHGFDGAFLVLKSENLEVKTSKLKTLFIEDGPFPVPFQVKSVKEHGDGLIVNLHLLPTYDDAKRWVGRNVYAENTSAIQETEDASPVEITGYTLHDIESGFTGTIDKVFEYAGQWMMEVNPGEKWIPLTEAYIRHIDEKLRKIEVNLPEGLLDL